MLVEKRNPVNGAVINCRDDLYVCFRANMKSSVPKLQFDKGRSKRPSMLSEANRHPSSVMLQTVWLVAKEEHLRENA